MQCVYLKYACVMFTLMLYLFEYIVVYALLSICEKVIIMSALLHIG